MSTTVAGTDLSAAADPLGSGDLDEVTEAAGRIVASVSSVIEGKPDVIRLSVIVLLAGGHLLVEDVPGVGKTMLAKSLARSIDCSMRRIQFTPDLMPSDVTGVSVFNQQTREFEFRPGGIFANVVLGDEINRASPKTQSAMLEAMEESQVSVDGQTYPLEAPFLVVATQNPVEMEGTYPLPEAQRDRFMVQTAIGYPSATHEVAMIDTQAGESSLAHQAPVTTAADVARFQELVRSVHLADVVKGYIVDLVALHPALHRPAPRRVPARNDPPRAGRSSARCGRRPRLRASRRRAGVGRTRARAPAAAHRRGADRSAHSRRRGERPRAEPPGTWAGVHPTVAMVNRAGSATQEPRRLSHRGLTRRGWLFGVARRRPQSSSGLVGGGDGWQRVGLLLVALLGLSGLAVARTRLGLQAARSVDPRRVPVDSETTVHLDLRSSTFVPAGMLRLEDTVPGAGSARPALRHRSRRRQMVATRHVPVASAPSRPARRGSADCGGGGPVRPGRHASGRSRE